MSNEAPGRLDMFGLKRAQRALDVLFAEVKTKRNRYVDSFFDGMAPFHKVIVPSPFGGEGFVAGSPRIVWFRR